MANLAEGAIINFVVVTGPGNTGKDTIISEFKERYYIPYSQSPPQKTSSQFEVLSTVQVIKDFLKKCGIMESDKCESMPQRALISEIKNLLDSYESVLNRIVFTEAKAIIEQLIVKTLTDQMGGLTVSSRSFIFIHCREPHNINNLCRLLRQLKSIYQSMVLQFPVTIEITKLGIVPTLHIGGPFNERVDTIDIDEESKILTYNDGVPIFDKAQCHLDLVIRNNIFDDNPGVEAAKELAKYFQILEN